MNFNFKEEDSEGLLTLEAIRNAWRFNQWMYEQVAPYMQGEILEIGSGIGNISDFFIRAKANITLSDVRTAYTSALSKRFTDYAEKKSPLIIDLVADDFKTQYKDLEGKFDSAFALNVIEHIKEDQLALQNLNFLLKPNARILILVPAHPSLYNRIDSNLQHFQRYKRRDLENTIRNSGFKIEKSFGFNAMAIPVWWLSGKILRISRIRNSQMHLYDKLVPFAKLLDRISGNKSGLSEITVATKI